MQVKAWRQIVLSAALLALTAFVTVQPVVSAITSADLKCIAAHTCFYGKGLVSNCNASTAAGNESSGIGATQLHGRDPEQKAFNYFLDQQLGDAQAAALVGNFMIESSMVPTADNGSHRGIAQWDYAGRYAKLKEYATNTKRADKVDTLPVQLDYVWAELNGTKPAGDYSSVLKQLKTMDGAGQVAKAATFVQNNYEGAVGQATNERVQKAQEAYKNYGGSSGGGGGGVSGADASCSSDGAVNCSGSNNGTGSLSPVRQQVVCLTETELQLWKSGKMKAGHDFFKYSQGRDELWCADFVTWIYNKAGKPMSSAKGGNLSLVNDVSGGVPGSSHSSPPKGFTYHPAGSYVPVPGDIAVYQTNGTSHVNIVVSVNTKKTSLTVVGGDQHGSGGADGNVVNEYTLGAFSGTGDLTGFVSPD